MSIAPSTGILPIYPQPALATPPEVPSQSAVAPLAEAPDSATPDGFDTSGQGGNAADKPPPPANAESLLLAQSSETSSTEAQPATQSGTLALSVTTLDAPERFDFDLRA